MGLNEIIENYLNEKSINEESAIVSILKEFNGESSRVLNRRYLAIFMLGEQGDGYDPVNETFYQVDPEVKMLDLEPEDGQFILFQKKGVHSGGDTYSLKEEGKRPFIQRLQIVGTEEIIDAHVYDEKSIIYLASSYENSIGYAKWMKLKSIISGV